MSLKDNGSSIKPPIVNHIWVIGQISKINNLITLSSEIKLEFTTNPW
jgi:hypothetical protein